MGRVKTVVPLIKTKTERFTYENVFLEAILDDIDYISAEEVGDYYSDAEEHLVGAGEIYCFLESKLHEANFRMTARKDFELLVHYDKNDEVSVLLPLDEERYVLVPTDNFDVANELELIKYCNAIRGKVKSPNALIIKKEK